MEDHCRPPQLAGVTLGTCLKNRGGGEIHLTSKRLHFPILAKHMAMTASQQNVINVNTYIM